MRIWSHVINTYPIRRQLHGVSSAQRTEMEKRAIAKSRTLGSYLFLGIATSNIVSDIADNQMQAPKARRAADSTMARSLAFFSTTAFLLKMGLSISWCQRPGVTAPRQDSMGSIPWSIWQRLYLQQRKQLSLKRRSWGRKQRPWPWLQRKWCPFADQGQQDFVHSVNVIFRGTCLSQLSFYHANFNPAD